jgi:hypothetical protein
MSRQLRRNGKAKRGNNNGKRPMIFSNTIQEHLVGPANRAGYTLQQLLGTSLAERKVKLSSISVQFLPDQLSEAANDIAAQLKLGGTIWTGQVFSASTDGNDVPNQRYKVLNRVRPTVLSITPFQPTMKVALNSEDLSHGMSITFNGNPDGVFVIITTKVQLMPQHILVDVTRSPRAGHDIMPLQTGNDSSIET